MDEETSSTKLRNLAGTQPRAVLLGHDNIPSSCSRVKSSASSFVEHPYPHILKFDLVSFLALKADHAFRSLLKKVPMGVNKKRLVV